MAAQPGTGAQSRRTRPVRASRWWGIVSAWPTISRIWEQARRRRTAADDGDRAAATKLRDALADLDQADVETKLQRSADWMRRGIDPNTNSNESQIQKRSAALERTGAWGEERDWARVR